MSDRKIRVAIVGVGNCASSLVQGTIYYRNVPDDTPIHGLMHTRFGPYHVGDIEFVLGVDVLKSKVGKDLSEAIFAEPNNTIRFSGVPKLNAPVVRGPLLDGIGEYLANRYEVSGDPPENITDLLREKRVDVVVNFLPVGSQRATEYYAQAAIDAGAAFVNGIPVFIASSDIWAERFRHAGLPVVGDDIKSQVGATITHRQLVQLFADRGVRVDRTYQLNFGGNTDFLNMLERSRLKSKKISKTEAVQSILPTPLPDEDIHIGPSDYVPWLDDRKIAYIRIEGTTFGGVPLTAELKLEVWDSPNSAGVMIDAIRSAKIALDAGIGGPLIGPSAYFMKHPPKQMPDVRAREAVERFIADYAVY